ncbi:MAG: thiamine phosphate synthase [Bacteroidales bacterium]
MKLIVITSEKTYPQETEAIRQLLEAGLGTLHLRKPSWSKEQTVAFLESIDPVFHNRIVLHDHYDLTGEYIVRGVHLNARNEDKLEGLFSDAYINSDTLRSIEDLEEPVDECKYHFLSPVYDSISKEGYSSKFTKEELQKAKEKGLIKPYIIALGGVTEDKIDELFELGFGGFAMLGSFWADWEKDFDNEKLVRKYQALQARCNEYTKKRIPRFHGLTIPDKMSFEELLITSMGFSASGLPLLQFRNKHADLPTKVMTCAMLRPMCKSMGTTFIINDEPDLANEVCADGVHLGKNDMPVAEARRLMGNNTIIGGTANTFEDIERLVAEGANYIGLGPYRFTKTKDNLSPVLGIEGYRSILAKCKEKGINTPIVAIGGITLEDIPELMKTGIHGVAMCSSLRGRGAVSELHPEEGETTEGYFELILKTIYENA